MANQKDSLVDHMPRFLVWKMRPPCLWSCLNGFLGETVTSKVVDAICLVIVLGGFAGCGGGGGAAVPERELARLMRDWASVEISMKLGS